MAKHTPGPWVAEAGEIISRDGDVIVAEVDAILVCAPESPEEREANARLIAAAPDLLAALKGMLDQPETTEAYDASMERALAAIAKAEGQ